MAKAGKQNIRDNNAARVAGPGRICFWPQPICANVAGQVRPGGAGRQNEDRLAGDRNRDVL